MLDYVTDVKPYRDGGLSFAEIATALESSRLTVRNIDITSDSNQENSIVQMFAFEFGVMRMNPANQGWDGMLPRLAENELLTLFPEEHPQRPLAIAVDAALDSRKQDLKTALSILAPFLQIQNQVLSSSTLPTSAVALYLVTEVVKALAPLLPLPVPPTPEQVDARLNSIHGGRRYDGVTEEDVRECAESWDAAEAEREETEARNAEFQALRNRFWELHNKHIATLEPSLETDIEVWRSAIRSIADEM